MKPETLQKLVTEATADNGNFQTVLYTLESEVPVKHTKEYRDQYDVRKHPVFSKSKRPDKPIKDDPNDPTKITDWEKVNRIGLPMQKLIAQTAAAFLCANPIKYDSQPKEGPEKTMLDCLNRVASENKLDFRDMELAERMSSETECAELWYTEPIEVEDEFWQGLPITTSYRLRMLIISPAKGDTLYPVFSPNGDMIAFARAYQIKDGRSWEWHVELYTATEIFKAVKTTGSGGGWEVTAEPNMIGKIPVIYYHQHFPEWHDVQSQIERLETQLSNHAETNDYFARPMLFIKGQLISISRKADNGKILEGSSDSDAKILSWDNAPESIKLEIDNLLRFIYACTSTPDISFDNLKGLASPSGFALEMMFMGAHLKAARKAGDFGQMKQRSINYQKAAIAKLDVTLKPAAKLQVTPKFEFFTIKDLDALTSRVTTAVAGGVMSTETGVKTLGAVPATDVETEVKKIESESAAKMSVPALLQ